jgi:hypothetical protein
MSNVSVHCDLDVIIHCHRCNLILYRDVRQVYQTKGGRWEKSITVLKDEIDSHRECRKEDCQ